MKSIEVKGQVIQLVKCPEGFKIIVGSQYSMLFVDYSAASLAFEGLIR